MKTHYYTEDIINICTDKHLTVDQIFSFLQEKYPEIGRSSIYRNVEQLLEKWKLKKVIWIGKKAYFETNIWNHIHLIDEASWNIIDLPMDSLNFNNLPKNFNIINTDIKIFWTFNEK